MVGLELRDFINPELCWKVSKGYRSGRSRKAAARGSKLKADQAAKDIRNGVDTPVSESEKLGVAVLRRRFSDNIEHVPIKKRRFMVQSPSPTLCLHSQHKGPEECMDYKQALGQKPFTNSVVRKQCASGDNFGVTGSGQISDAFSDVTNDEPEDFSGIEILAAAACNNIVVDTVSHNEETPVVEESTPAGSDRSTVAIPLEEATTSVETVNSSTKDMIYENGKDRLSFHDAVAKNPWSDQDARSTNKCSVSSRDERLHWDLNVSMDAWEQPCDDAGVDHLTDAGEVLSLGCKNKTEEVCERRKESRDDKHDIPAEVRSIVSNEEHKLEVSSGIDKINVECIQSNNPLEASSTVANNENASLQTLFKDTLVSDDGAPSPQNIPVKNISEVKSTETAFLCPSVPESATCKINSEDASISSGLLEDCRTPQGSSLCSCHHAVQVEVKSTVKAGDREDISSSGLSLGEGRPLLAVNTEEQVDSAVVRPGYEDVMLNTCSRVSSAGGESVPKNVSQEYGDYSPETGLGGYQDKDQSVRKENNMELKEGYDSQYEDGELRDSDVHDWEMIEGVDMEIDYVDYESEDFDTCNGDAVEVGSEHGEAKIVEDSVRLEKGLGPGPPGSDNVIGKTEHCTMKDALKNASVVSKTKLMGSTLKPTEKVTEGCIMRRHTNSMPDDNEVGSTQLVLSCDDESLSSALPHKTEDILKRMMISDNIKHSTRGEKDPRNVENHGYLADSERPMLEAVGVSGSDYHSRQSMNSFSSGLYRAPLRRRSPTNFSNNSYDNVNRGGVVTMRDLSPDRRRFKRYQQGDRPIRNEYYIPERIRTERSISPSGRGPINYPRPYKRSFSRSRSRSPLSRVSPKDRTENFRHQNSRSPDYRFLARTKRLRVPFQKPGFYQEEDEMRFMPQQRRRVSSQQNPKWIEDSSTDHFRTRRLPFEMFRPSQRFDSGAAHMSRKFNSKHDYFDSGMEHSRRFPGKSYEGGGDYVRGNYHGGRYKGGGPRVRHYGSGERRCRYDGEDTFVPYNDDNHGYEDDVLNNRGVTDRRTRGGGFVPKTRRAI